MSHWESWDENFCTITRLETLSLHSLKLNLCKSPLTSLSYDLYSVLDNQKALNNTFQTTTFKVEENLRPFQGLPLKFKEFSRLCESCKIGLIISLHKAPGFPLVQGCGKPNLPHSLHRWSNLSNPPILNSHTKLYKLPRSSPLPLPPRQGMTEKW